MYNKNQEQVRSFWNKSKVEIFKKTGDEDIVLPMNPKNKLVSSINEIINGNDKKTKFSIVDIEDIVGSKRFCGLLKLVIVQKGKGIYNNIYNFELKYTKTRSSLKIIIKSLDKKSLKVNSKSLFSTKDFFKKKKEEMINVIGEEAFDALLKGSTLNVWRNSTPHNRWINSPNGKGNYLWHSEKYERPDMSLFEEAYKSSQTVSYGGSFFRGGDEGMSQESKYKLSQWAIKGFKSL